MVLALALGVVVVRLGQLQVLDPDSYAARGVAQRQQAVVLPATRGAITDRHGVELALTAPRRTVWADPRLVRDPVAAARALAPVLDVERDVLEERLSRDVAFVYLARQVDEKVADAVGGLDLEGVELVDEPGRVRPSGELAASVIGGVDIDNRGLSGLERQYEDLLVGKPGELLVERGPDGGTIATGEHRMQVPVAGDGLALTIDRALQHGVEEALGDQVAATGADGGAAIVMDPKSGEILAMASFRAGEDGEAPRPAGASTAVTTLFEPGSVNKIVTISAALEEGLFTPEDTLVVPSRLRVSSHVYSDSFSHATAQWSLTDIITRSSNIGTIKVAQQLGPQRVDGYLRDFGLGRRTGLGYPDEPAGLLLPLENWEGTSIGSIPLGQGVAVTPLQMLDAFNVIANGGTWVEPTLVAATVGAGGARRPTPVPERRRVVSERTASQMRAMLANVVAKGTGRKAAVPGYEVAGKTGTAQKPSTTSRGYEEGAYSATFAGFVPADDPQISVIVVLDEPTPYYGGQVSAPVFAQIVEHAVRVLGIPADGTSRSRSGPTTTTTLPAGAALPRD